MFLNKFTFVSLGLVLVGVLTFFIGCTGQQGPAGPTGSTGSPGSTYFQANFQNGVYPNASYSGELDTWLNAASAGTPTNASPFLEVNTGAAYSNYGRILVKFDVSSLPANATVVAAEVWLKLNSATAIGSSPVTIGVHNLASSTFSTCHWLSSSTWLGDGGSGWNSCTGDSSAQQSGLYNPTTLSSVVFTNSVNGTNAFYRWTLGASIVQSWLTSASNNNGLILKSEGEFGESTSSVDFYPYNDGTASNRPQLIVTYY